MTTHEEDREQERRIARQCIADLLAAGYFISVYDGGATPVRKSRDEDEIFGAMMSTDEDKLLVYPDNSGSQCAGWVLFIYGNSGWEVINDYTTNLEATLAKTMALIDEMQK